MSAPCAPVKIQFAQTANAQRDAHAPRATKNRIGYCVTYKLYHNKILSYVNQRLLFLLVNIDIYIHFVLRQANLSNGQHNILRKSWQLDETPSRLLLLHQESHASYQMTVYLTLLLLL